MKYIKKVVLENFQSHKHTVVDFDSRLNVIVGPSDSGKTAILRGIRWALYNDPSGDYFIREEESECSVTIIFDDGTKIKRYRSKNKNSYYLYDKHDNEFKFEGFGTYVPDEIIEATGIKKIFLDKNISKAINISDQLDGAFLLSEKGSIRASSIGYLVGVDIIDDALKETLRESRNLSNNKRNIDENIIKLEKDLSKYDYLKELGLKVDKLEDTLNKINNKERLLVKYKDILSKVSKVKDEKIKLNIYTKRLQNLYQIEILLNNIELNNIKHKQLSKQKNLLDSIKLDKQKNGEIINSLKNINLVNKNINKLSLISIKKAKLSEINFKMNKVYNEIKSYKYIDNKLTNLNNLQENIIEIDNIVIKLKKLSQIKDKTDDVKKSLSIGHIYIYKLKEIDNISNIYIEIEKELNTINHIMKLSSNYNINKKTIIELNNEIKGYKSKFDFLSTQYKNILLKKGTCPLCFSHIDSEKANYIVNQYK